ncbi:hypothetical protein D3C73_498620 [compost metagenome]
MLGQLPIALGIARQQGAARVFAAELGVEHHPARHARGAFAVVGVHRVNDIGIGRGFVDETLPRRVDHHTPRQGAFNEQRPLFFFTLDVSGRRPPAVLHQRGPSTDGLAGANTVAGIVGWRGTPVGPGRLRQVLLAHRLVTLETTGGDDHPVARLDVEQLTVAIDPCPADPVADQQQLFECTVEPQRLAAILQRTAQGTDQGIAQGQETVATG